MTDTEQSSLKKKLGELRVIDLRSELEKRGLDKNGVKTALIERLSKAIQDEGQDPAEFLFEVGVEKPVVKTPVKRSSRKTKESDSEAKESDSEVNECSEAKESDSEVNESQEVTENDSEVTGMKESSSEAKECLEEQEGEPEVMEISEENDPEVIESKEGDSESNECEELIEEEVEEEQVDEEQLEEEQVEEEQVDEEQVDEEQLEEEQGDEEEEEEFEISEEDTKEVEKKNSLDSEAEKNAHLNGNNPEDGTKTSISSPPKPETAPVVAPLTVDDILKMDITSKMRAADNDSLIVHPDDTQSDMDTSVNEKDSVDNDAVAEESMDTESSDKKADEESSNVEETADTKQGGEELKVSSEKDSNATSDTKKENDNSAETVNASSENKAESSEPAQPKSVESEKKEKEPSAAKGANIKRVTASGKNLWVSGLAEKTRANDLKTLFNKFGKVSGAKIVTNAKTPGARCYGFITMASNEEALLCIEKLNRTELHGRIITVEKTTREPTGSIKRAELKAIQSKAPVKKTEKTEEKPSKENADVLAKKDKDPSEKPGKTDAKPIDKPKSEKTKEKKDEKGKDIKEKEGKEKDGKEKDGKEKDIKEKDGKDKENEKKKEGTDEDKRGLKRRAGSKESDRRSHKSRDKSRDEKRRDRRSRTRSRSRSRSHERRDRMGYQRGYYRRPYNNRGFGTRRPYIGRNYDMGGHFNRDHSRDRDHDRFSDYHDRDRQRDIERKNREESLRLDRERERLRIEREKLERERAEVLRLEREKQRFERERLEREKAELRKRMTLSDFDRERGSFSDRRSDRFERSKGGGDVSPTFSSSRRDDSRSSFRSSSRSSRDERSTRDDWKGKGSRDRSFERSDRTFDRPHPWESSSSDRDRGNGAAITSSTWAPINKTAESWARIDQPQAERWGSIDRTQPGINLSHPPSILPPSQINLFGGTPGADIINPIPGHFPDRFNTTLIRRY